MKSGCKDIQSKFKKHVGCIIDGQNKEGGLTKIKKIAFDNALISVDFPFFYLWIPKIIQRSSFRLKLAQAQSISPGYFCFLVHAFLKLLQTFTYNCFVKSNPPPPRPPSTPLFRTRIVTEPDREFMFVFYKLQI